MKKHIYCLILAIALLGCAPIERDYLALHRKALVADMHSDTVLRMKNGTDISLRGDEGHMDIPRLQEGGVDLQVFACWINTDTERDSCRPKIDLLIDTLEAAADRHSEAMAICRTAGDAESAIASGKIAAVLGIENGVAIAGDLDNIKHYYERGVRYMTLTHTASSEWVTSSADTAPAFDGLTDFGRDVVRTMNELGMIVDISHASVEAVEQVLKVATAPLIASHSGVHAIYEHDRNLTDEQIKAVAANGGVIGVIFYNGYISTEFADLADSLWGLHRAEFDSLKALYADNDSLYRVARKPLRDSIYAQLEGIVDVGTVVDHIDYIVKLVGPDYVGLGSDYDGVPSMPSGLDDCSMMPNLTKELIVRGYSDEDIGKILGGNFMRVFKQVCGG
ncbi:MAG: dipeptidase [candidate division Zixibacteria bacterium]|nr:dipeptidase [candidate division Zixibacteria bacterium]MDH3936099.1 dipeptidase [candidate division Zixibacteria bacterium]MDH4032472.1 dipeptidase [candidate division Zixibacteria bacterium]